MSQITVLAECTVNAFSTITIELVEADETPAVIIVRWPNKSTITHPRRFPETAAVIARTFAAASTDGAWGARGATHTGHAAPRLLPQG
jgi:hypothetical protein